ncbi:GntR family transcriptional regulator [Sneathiella limimaris]|uniref:GntR family transcriptional regulator n=1 Tax=Sneathiella limimaris TaxID=1964213 RepID=UPI00146D405B|nr:GntR family transcriptional regulator [Sneathiella limimaris]
MTSDSPYTQRMSLYLKVANVLRNRILTGRWRKGDQLPNIMDLCDEFDVGRITVRQALHLLADEGFIDSKRGKGTFVISETGSGEAKKPRTAPFSSTPQKIEIISIGEPEPLPSRAVYGFKTYDRYVCVRKLHYHEEYPFCLMDIYVEETLFKKLPLDQMTKKTIAALIHKYSDIPINSAKQILKIGIADYENAAILNVDMSSPIAEFDRLFCSEDEHIISTGHYLYRGDLFQMETDHKGDPIFDMPSGWMPELKTQ